MKYYKFIILVFSLFALNSCETMDLEQTENPSAVSQNLLDPIYTFNYVQLQLPDFVDSANSFTQRVTRQMAMTGGNTYDNAFAPVNFNNNWFIAYNMLNAIKLSEPKAIEKKLYYELGASKVIRAYVLATLVDIYGDIPLSEALLGVANLTPKYDSGASVYKQVLVDLDEAIAILSVTPKPKLNVKSIDLYYSSEESWIKLANTIKLKMLATARLAGSDLGLNVKDELNVILSSGNYIKNTADNFEFKFGNSRFTPNTRHPLYNDQYELGGGAYLCNYLMWTVVNEKGTGTSAVIDPREKFYFFKQKVNLLDIDESILLRQARPNHFNNPEYASFYNPAIVATFKVSNWTTLSNTFPGTGYLGRDHGDNSGIPQDNEDRTVAGVYPVGGEYARVSGDYGSVQNSGSDGAKGAGVMPIIMSSYVHFMIAEAILELGISGVAVSELELGIRQSIDRVIPPSDKYPLLTVAERGDLTTLTNTYVNFVVDEYNTLSNAKKLELIIKEFYIASWGNGIETYNNYRRTGYPSNFQPTVEPSTSSFYYTAFYPGSAENNNPNVPTNVRTRRVFWDKANLILQ